MKEQQKRVIHGKALETGWLRIEICTNYKYIICPTKVSVVVIRCARRNASPLPKRDMRVRIDYSLRIHNHVSDKNDKTRLFLALSA
jgi:hypothetical protein